MDQEFYNRVGRKRIGDRQMDTLIGLVTGIVADGVVNRREVEVLYKWLAANEWVAGHPILTGMLGEVEDVIGGKGGAEARLLKRLEGLAGLDFEAGEVAKPATTPLCDPAPALVFEGMRYTLTGTFVRGKRAECEDECRRMGADVGTLTKATRVLVIGSYVTDSWKHGNWGNKVEQAVVWRAEGHPIAIVTENHWASHL